MAALKSLRRVDDDMVIWADAICINQANEREKEHQVPLMDQIYLNAASVLIWLGPLEGFADKALGFLESLELHGNKPKLDSIPHEVAIGIEYLCSKNYWTRAWIVQEVLMAKSLIIYSGTKKTSWSIFTHVVETLSKTEEYTHLTELGFVHRLLTLRTITAVMPFQALARFSLEDLLALFGEAKCYNVQDRIFSMLGLTRELVRHKSVIVDYKQDFGTLFATVMGLRMPRCPARLAYLLQNALAISSLDFLLISNLDVSQLSPSQSIARTYFEGLQREASRATKKAQQNDQREKSQHMEVCLKEAKVAGNLRKISIGHVSW
jgi:hypothetical protein